MRQIKIKHNRKEIRKFCIQLIYFMSFMDRLSFLNGNIYGPMRRSLKNNKIVYEFEWQKFLFWFDVLLLYLIPWMLLLTNK